MAVLALASSLTAASRLTNVSVRSSAGTGSDTLIVGFTIGGTGSTQILLRGVGPALGGFGVTAAVADPELRVFNNAAAAVGVATNDNWDSTGNLTAIGDSVGAFRLAAGSRDAAMLLTLGAGSYSAHLLANSGPGIALVEGYEVPGAAATAPITNLSTRSLAGTGASVLTIGFAITGDVRKTVLIRAVGPTLGSFGVGGTLANPQLRLFSSRNAELGYNDDWLTATAAGWSAAYASVGAFSLGNASTRDAALLVSLPPGSYTAQASGVGSTSGVALIEIYDVPALPAASFVFQPQENAVPAGFGSGSTGASAPPTDISRVNTVPAVVTQARPVYPFELRLVGATGDALIQFIVDIDGTVSEAFIVRTHDIRLGESALAAVRQWTFQPGRVNGQAVRTVMQVPIVYTLN
jgi:TonB family protein